MGTEGNNLNLLGRVVDGKNEASIWLEKYNDAYSRKLGLKIYPGSLNIVLEADFFLLKSAKPSKVIKMSKLEYGGERNILMKPCLIFDRLAYIWRTENAENGLIDDFDFRLVEIIADIHLRSRFSIENDHMVEIKIP